MAGTVREAKLATRTARARLRCGRQPHWQTIVAGKAHLGWQRWPEDRTGRRLLRRRRGGRYGVEQVGLSDDDAPADGGAVLTHEQARAMAMELVNGRSVSPYTVSRCMADYVDYLTAAGKNTVNATAQAANYIIPHHGAIEVAELTAQQLRRWLADVAASPARKRPKRGEVQFKAPPADDESIRRRRTSANRTWTHYRAALEHAFQEGRVSSNGAWRRVKKFRGVDAARVCYLTIAEADRLINASDPILRNLVRAALETGMRYSELARLKVHDFNQDAGAVTVLKSKSGHARHVVLTEEGADFFRRACARRSGTDLMFPRPDGQPWRRSNQGRLMAEACERARISPPVGFHQLRHTYASHCVMGGAPLMTVAANLGHRDITMVQRHYAHLAPSFVSDAIRRAAPRFAAGGKTNVTPIR